MAKRKKSPGTYRGQVKNGVVVLIDEAALPEGTEVSVRPLRPARGKRPQGLTPGMRKFAGKARGLPPDASRNLEHYLYGRPKQ